MKLANVLNHIEIVLVSPQHGGNIGSAARAMKNMGLSRLVLVSPKKKWRSEAKKMAMHAEDIIRCARVVRTITSAIKDSTYIVGTTRRGGEARSPVELSENVADEILERATAGKVSIVFGNERIGLSSSELGACHTCIVIPTSPDQPSLNLAHAVLLVAYEIFRRSSEKKFPVHRKNPEKYMVSDRHLDEMCTLIRPALAQLGYRNHAKKDFLDKLLFNIKRTARKCRFELRDVKMIEGLARRVIDQKAKNKAHTQGKI